MTNIEKKDRLDPRGTKGGLSQDLEWAHPPPVYLGDSRALCSRMVMRSSIQSHVNQDSFSISTTVQGLGNLEVESWFSLLCPCSHTLQKH